MRLKRFLNWERRNFGLIGKNLEAQKAGLKCNDPFQFALKLCFSLLASPEYYLKDTDFGDPAGVVRWASEAPLGQLKIFII